MIYGSIAAVVVLCSIVSFALYAIDKSKAKRNKWRVSEATLIGSAFFMGGIGAMLAMKFLRHKTQHTSFKILVPLATLVNIAVVAGIVVFVL